MHVALLALALVSQDAADPLTVNPEAADPAPVSTLAIALLEDVPPSLEGWEPDLRARFKAARAFTQAGREDLAQAQRVYATRYQCPIVEGSAQAAALAAADGAQVIVLDDSSAEPRTHAFIGGLLAELADRFDVYAAVSLNPWRLDPRRPGALGIDDREPIFARTIAIAEANDYRIVSLAVRVSQRGPRIEDPVAREAARDEILIDNLIDQVLAADPDARVLIHVHSLGSVEATLGGDAAPQDRFAARLAARTGIDPFTITQSFCQPALGEDAALDAAPPLGWPPQLARTDHQTPLQISDMILAYPPVSFTDLRPNWRRVYGDVELAAPEVLQPQDQPVILEARAVGASIDAMPVDRLLLYPGERAPLLTPPGDWVVTAWTVNGQWGDAIRVSAPSLP